MSQAFGIGPRNDAAQPSQSWAASGQDQAQLEEIDGSEALFTMYIERAGKEDKEMAERWKADADSILIFSGLFSATVATAIGLTYPDLKRNPQDTANFYLANIYQLLATSNGSHITIPTTMPDPPPFFPPQSAIWVNYFWFSSLLLSLTSALCAILLQQWARLYLTTSHPRHTLFKEARIRELLAKGVNEFGLHGIANALLMLHHYSFIFFLVGLAILLVNTTGTPLFAFVAPWIVAIILAYTWFTCVPVFWSNGPYSTPFSPLVGDLTYFALSATRFVARFTCPCFKLTSWCRLQEAISRRRRLSRITRAEEYAQTHSQELDCRALLWTFKSLSEDQELELFISGIPSFCSSKAIEDPLSCLAKLAGNGLSRALFSLMHRTLTSNLVSESVKQRKIRVCTKAIDAASIDLVSWRILRRVFGEWDGLLGSLDFGRSVVRIIDNDHPRTDFCARCIVSIIITRSQEDGGWSGLATALLGISDDTLSRYNAGGCDNVRLATLNFTIRHSLRSRFDLHPGDELFPVLSKTLDELLLDIDVRRAPSELQQEFCGVWNELVHTARDGAGVHRQSTATEILRLIRKCYIAFHEHTDPNTPSQFYETTATNNHDPILSLGSAYPLCSVQGHHPIPLPPDPDSSEGNTDVAVAQGTSPAPTIVHPIPLTLDPESSEENTDVAVTQGTSSTVPTIVQTAHPVQDATVPAVSDSLTPSTSRFQPPS